MYVELYQQVTTNVDCLSCLSLTNVYIAVSYQINVYVIIPIAFYVC